MQKQSALPRDARQAAASGFDFSSCFSSTFDEFVGASEMKRSGTLEVEDQLGNTAVVPFEAVYKFGKPTLS